MAIIKPLQTNQKISYMAFSSNVVARKQAFTEMVDSVISFMFVWAVSKRKHMLVHSRAIDSTMMKQQEGNKNLNLKISFIF